MAELVEVSYVKRRFEEPRKDRGPWRQVARSAVALVRAEWEIERRPAERQWDFFVTITGGGGVPVIV